MNKDNAFSNSNLFSHLRVVRQYFTIAANILRKGNAWGTVQRNGDLFNHIMLYRSCKAHSTQHGFVRLI